VSREREPICPRRPLPHWVRLGPLEVLQHRPSPIWRAVRLHRPAAMASSQRSMAPSFPVAWRVGVLPWRAALRDARPARRSPPSSARRKRGRLRRHHRAPTAGMTDKKGDPCRCPTLESTSPRDEGFEESYRGSTSALTVILPVATQFSQTLPPFRRRRPACFERQLPRPTASAKIPRNRAVARDFFAADDRCRLLHGVAQGCPGPWTAATIPFTCRSRAAIGS
jgi:hypothetical protein